MLKDFKDYVNSPLNAANIAKLLKVDPKKVIELLNRKISKKDENYKNLIPMLTIQESCDRDIMKKIFMPIVYGKTSYSASVDIQKKFIKLIGEDQASLNIAHICYHYWGVKYEKPDGFDSSY